MADDKLKSFDFPLNGRLITKLDPSLLPEAHFQTLQNMRYNDGGIEPVSGMTKINASAFNYTKCKTGFQFRKEIPNTESHTIIQTNSATTGQRLIKSDNSTSVPAQDTFSTFITLPTANYVNFSEAPDQSMVMCDGYTNYVYSGNEYRVAQLINYDPSGSFFYDYTEIANNNLTDSDNVFSLGGTGGGIDSNTITCLHLDNNVTDSETSPKTFTNANVTFSSSAPVFGTYNAVFNGSNAKLTTPAHADFDFTSGTFTIDCRVKLTSSSTQPLFYQSTDVTKISFTGGVVEPIVGDTVNGQTSSATGVVEKVVVDTGAWATSDAAGTLYISAVTGTWQNAENVRTVTTVNATTASTASSAGTNSISFYISAYNVYFVIHECYGSGSDVVSLSTTGSPLSTYGTSSWFMVSLVESGNNYYIFIGSTAGTANLYAATSSANRPSKYDSVVSIGYNGSNYAPMSLDEYRVSKSARWVDSYSVPVAAYSSATSISYLYVGTTRPISGVKFYVKTANASSATATGYYWSGTAWIALSNISDGTATAGKTLAKTGSITFDSTVLTSEVKSINENVAYYYQIVFSGIDVGTEISQVTCYAPPQGLTDIWDGFPRQIYSFLKQTAGVYSDLTVNVYQLDFVSGDTLTYADISSLPTTDYFYIGFNERLLGFKTYFGGNNVNTNASIISVDYWNGYAWTSVGSVDDGTAVAGKSFNRPGVITWNSPSSKVEYPTSVGSSAQWYMYRVHFSATLSANTFIDNITGIPAQVALHPYRFAVLWQNRLWLLNDQSRNKNIARGSSYGTVCVFNGDDSPTLTFGGTQEVVCAAPLFTRYGGSIYENLVVCKRNQTYLVDGTSPETYVVYKIANTVGCISPRTMVVCDTGYEVAQGLTKHVVVWLSSSGVVMFDANSVINISSDINDRFDPTSSNYINSSIAENFNAFYDARRFEYHLQIATGSSTTLNEEWVYDLVRRKWYQMNRGAKYLSCGLEVEDSVGNKYCYGGTDDGYLERLDYGNTFDGVSITYKFRLPDGLLDKSLMYVKELRLIKLTGKVNTTGSTITVRHYADCSTTASTINSLSQNASGKRVYQLIRSVSLRGVFHSLEFEITTSDVAGGFYPLYVSGFYKTIREDLGGS